MRNRDPEETETHRVLKAQDIAIRRRCRRRSEKPTTEKQKQNLAMGYIRDIVATELASSNPSLKLDSIVHDRRLAELVSALKTPTHPAYGLMIRKAIEVLNEEGGSSEKAISEFIVKEYENLPLAHEAILKHHLRKLCEKRELLLKDNEWYILLKDCAVGKQQKKRKNVRRKGRPSRGDDKDSEETDGRYVGEGNQSMEREIEGIHANRNREERREVVVEELGKGTEENFEVIEIRSEAEREETAVSEALMESKSMKLDKGVSDEAIVEQFNKAKHEASQSLRNEEHDEENEPVEEQKLVIISEPNKPQQQQTQVIEEQLQLEEVQNQHQQDTAELNKRIPTTTTPSADPIQRRKLRSHTRHNSGSASISELPLLSQQAEHQGKERQCRQRDSKRIRDMENKSEAELPLVFHQHQNEPSLKRCRAKGSPAKPTSDVDAAMEALPPSDVEQKLQGEKESSLLQQEPKNQTSHWFQRRILRSHHKESSICDSATPEQTLSCVPTGPQNMQRQQAVAQHEIDGPKIRRENQTSHQLQQRVLHSHHKEPSISNSASPTLMLLRVPSKWQNKQQQQAVAQHEIDGQKIQSENQTFHQLQQIVLRFHHKEPLIFDSASPTLTLSRVPSKQQNKQQQQAQHQVLGKRGRPPKLKPDVDLNARAALSSALQPNEGDEQPLKQRGRGRPPKPKPNADAAIAVFKPPKRGGRLPKEEETEMVTMASFSNRFLRKKPKGQGKPPKAERGASRFPERPRKDGRGRPPKVKS